MLGPYHPSGWFEVWQDSSGWWRPNITVWQSDAAANAASRVRACPSITVIDAHPSKEVKRAPHLSRPRPSRRSRRSGNCPSQDPQAGQAVVFTTGGFALAAPRVDLLQHVASSTTVAARALSFVVRVPVAHDG